MCWLSRGKILTRLFKLSEVINVFFTDLHFHLAHHLLDDELLTRLAYLGNVFSRLNDLNLVLQGLRKYIRNAE